MSDRVDVRQAVVIVLATMALVAAVVDAPSPARAVLTYPFVLIGPGLAIAGLLRIRNALIEAAIVVPVSLSTQTLLATLLVYIGAYSSALVLVASLAVALAALVVDRFIGRRPDAEPRHADGSMGPVPPRTAGP